MPRQIHSFDPPDRFVAGTVGAPGERSFFLQARGGGRVVSVGIEKVQVQILADRLGELLDELGRRGVEVPASAAVEQTDVAPLDSPAEEEFRVVAVVLGWDPDRSRVVVEAQGPSDEPPTEALSDDVDGPDVLRIWMPPAAVRAFVERAHRVIAAGRPPCPLCGLPLDPSGHVCPRQNGHLH